MQGDNGKLYILAGGAAPCLHCGLLVVETEFLSSSKIGVDGFSGAIRRMRDRDDGVDFLRMKAWRVTLVAEAKRAPAPTGLGAERLRNGRGLARQPVSGR